VNLRQILLGMAISAGLTLATVGHAQNWHSRHMRTPTSDTTAPATPTGLQHEACTGLERRRVGVTFAEELHDRHLREDERRSR